MPLQHSLMDIEGGEGSNSVSESLDEVALSASDDRIEDINVINTSNMSR